MSFLSVTLGRVDLHVKIPTAGPGLLRGETLPQRLKPYSKHCIHRSAEALRHPKSGPTSRFSASRNVCKQASYRSGKPLRHPKSSATAGFFRRLLADEPDMSTP